MFRPLQFPSSGARQTAIAASGFRMNVEVEVFSTVFGLLVSTNRPRLRTLQPPHSYGNQRLQRQFDGLLMMVIVMPETCWAVSVRQSNKFYDWLLHLVGCFVWWKLYITDGNDIRPHTVQTHNERTSTEFNIVTAQSTALGPPEDGRIYIYGPKHLGPSFFRCFKCFKYWCEFVFLKCIKVCMSWNKGNNCNNNARCNNKNHKNCVLIFATTFVRNISRFKKN